MRRLIMVAAVAVAWVCPSPVHAVVKPIGVSPGDTAELARIADPCPTFSWGEVEGAEGYELVVYELGAAGEEAKEVLRRTFTGPVYGWTPAMESCLERGGRYAWSIRAVAADEVSEWSTPSLFRVVAGPTEADFRAALDVVRAYLEQHDPDKPQVRAEPQDRESPVRTPTGRTKAPKATSTGKAAVRPPGISTGLSMDDNLQMTTSDTPRIRLEQDDSVFEPQVWDLSGNEASFQVENQTLGGTPLRIHGDAPNLSLDIEATGNVKVQSVSGDGSGLTSLSPANLSSPVTLDKGGTGAVDAAGARTNLGVVAGPHTANSTCLDAGVICNFAGSASEGGPATTAVTATTALAGDSATGFFSTGQIEEPRIADALARDNEVQALVESRVEGLIAWAQRCPDNIGFRYVDPGDGTVLDCATGLIWLKDASCADLAGTDVDGKASWDAAPTVAASLADGTCGLSDGSSAGDWRMPTPAEFCSVALPPSGTVACPVESAANSLIDRSLSGSPKVENARGDGNWTEGDPFVGVQFVTAFDSYWTDTAKSVNASWSVNLGTGTVLESFHTNLKFIWPVRDPP